MNEPFTKKALLVRLEIRLMERAYELASLESLRHGYDVRVEIQHGNLPMHMYERNPNEMPRAEGETKPKCPWNSKPYERIG